MSARLTRFCSLAEQFEVELEGQSVSDVEDAKLPGDQTQDYGNAPDYDDVLPSDSVKGTGFRLRMLVVGICGLLCVVQILLIIALHLVFSNSKQLQTSLTSMTREREGCLVNLTSMTRERDDSLTSLTTMTREKDSYQINLTTMTREKNGCLTSLTSMTREKDSYQTNLTTMTREKNGCLTNLTSMTREREGCLVNLTNMTRERDGCLTSFTTMTREKDGCLTNLTTMTREKNGCLTSLTRERDGFQTNLTIMTKEKDGCLTNLTTRTREKDGCLTRLTIMTKKSDGLQTNLTSVTRERDGFQTNLTSVTRKRDGCLTSLTTRTRERDGFQREREIIFRRDFVRSSMDGGGLVAAVTTSQLGRIVGRRADWTVSAEELTWWSSTAERNRLAGNTWIGLSDSAVEGRWTWVDGTPRTTAYWYSGQPNNGYGNVVGEEDCATISSWPPAALQSWEDWPCSSSFYWICEREI